MGDEMNSANTAKSSYKNFGSALLLMVFFLSGCAGNIRELADSPAYQDEFSVSMGYSSAFRLVLRKLQDCDSGVTSALVGRDIINGILYNDIREGEITLATDSGSVKIGVFIHYSSENTSRIKVVSAGMLWPPSAKAIRTWFNGGQACRV